jgi:hypothetical protein
MATVSFLFKITLFKGRKVAGCRLQVAGLPPLANERSEKAEAGCRVQVQLTVKSTLITRKSLLVKF